MITALTLLCSLSLCPFTLPASVCCDDAEIKEAIGLVDSLAKDKDDASAAGVLKILADAHPKIEDPALRKKVAQAALKLLSRPRKGDAPSLYLEAIKALGKMGEEGRLAGLHALTHRSVKDRPPLMVAGIETLASHQNVRDADTVAKYLGHKEAKVVAAAAKSLGRYEKEDEKVRKKLVKEMVNHYTTYHGLSRTAGHARFFSTVRGAFDQGLRKLTSARVSGAEAWRDWHNENKNKRWGKTGKKG